MAIISQSFCVVKGMSVGPLKPRATAHVSILYMASYHNPDGTAWTCEDSYKGLHSLANVAAVNVDISRNAG